MRHYTSSVLIILSLIIIIIEGISSENSNDICTTQCNCAKSANGLILTINCSKQNLKKIINWPNHNTTIIATFQENNIETLEQLPASDAIIELNLSKCKIKYLQNGLFINVKNTKYLDLSYNLLESEELSAEKFKGPYNNTYYEPIALEYLNLAYNKIHSLNKNIFEHLPNLKNLNLEGNNLRILDIQTQRALSSIPTLHNLNLANNNLTEIVSTAIERFTNLTELNLSNNQLDFVPISLGLLGDSLNILNIDGNPILEFVDQTFMGLDNVIELSANNLLKLKYVNANTFVPMVKLRKLSLSNNFILENIDREAFRPNHTLDELYLNNNNLFRLDYNLLVWSKLRIFEINENPLGCSCDLYNITQELPLEITKNRDGPYCIDPRNNRVIQIFILKSDICLVKGNVQTNKQYIQYHFLILKISLVTFGVILMSIAVIVSVLTFTKYRRNKNYHSNSQVLYNSLTTD